MGQVGGKYRADARDRIVGRALGLPLILPTYLGITGRVYWLQKIGKYLIVDQSGDEHWVGDRAAAEQYADRPTPFTRPQPQQLTLDL